MQNDAIIYPFKLNFLKDFSFAADSIKMDLGTLKKLDETLTSSSQLSTNPDLEKVLISRNELFASFAISKAENSSLTLKEAEDLQTLLINDNDYDFIAKKLKIKTELTQKDHDKLEFFNIVKTFRFYNQSLLPIADLTPQFIQKIHTSLTFGLDIFAKHLLGFDIYQSGQFRDNDSIRVGSYKPAPYKDIDKGINELIGWVKDSPKSPQNIALFHTALYALHPFDNGNKRVCRILEHLLLRSIGFNQKNLYSPSYYYHTQKDRYYKYLLYSLEHHNLNHFTSFIIEALSYSMLDVMRASIELKKSDYLNNSALESNIKKILKPLIKRKEIQFKLFQKINSRKVVRQTFITYLQKATEQHIIERRSEGKKVYYSLSFKETADLELFHSWLTQIKDKVSYIPQDLIQF